MTVISVVVLGALPWKFTEEFEQSFKDAVEEEQRWHEPQQISWNRRYTAGGYTKEMTGVVIGSDFHADTQVYVINGFGGEKVTRNKGSKASLDALVDVLRGHGYTCTKKGGS